MPRPGEVFYLPPEPGDDPHKGDRPHVLVSLCTSESEVVTLAYGSTRPTDALRGAEHVLIDPSTSPGERTGLMYPTYVYLSRLVSYAAPVLGRSAGHIVTRLPQIRACLRRALGLGTGVTIDHNVPGSVRRGRMVELSAELREDWGVMYGLVVTEPAYSRSGFQQTIIPLLDEECETRDLDVPIVDARWLAALGPGYRTAVLAISMVSSVYQPEHIRRYLDQVAQPDLMAEVDSALTRHFGL